MPRTRIARSNFIEHLIATYPRSRPPLSRAHQSIFLDHYRRNRSDQGFSRLILRLERWMHIRVSNVKAGSALLELGAGTLNHFPYETGQTAYDAVEPFRPLWEHSPYRSAIRNIFEDIVEIPLHHRYDRIISIATLEHVTDLPLLLARSGLLLSREGTFQAGIPSEGAFLWGIGWRCTTGVIFRLTRGLSYAAMMRHEHINNAREIEALVRYFFADISLKRFPLAVFHLSFYTYIEARRPILDRCRAVLDLRTGEPHSPLPKE